MILLFCGLLPLGEVRARMLPGDVVAVLGTLLRAAVILLTVLANFPNFLFALHVCFLHFCFYIIKYVCDAYRKRTG